MKQEKLLLVGIKLKFRQMFFFMSVRHSLYVSRLVIMSNRVQVFISVKSF